MSLLKQQHQPKSSLPGQGAVASRFKELTKELVQDGQLMTITEGPNGEMQYVSSDLSDPKVINAIMQQAMLDADQTIKMEDGGMTVDQQAVTNPEESLVVGGNQLLIELKGPEVEPEKFIRGSQKRATLRDVEGLEFQTANLLELQQAEAHAGATTGFKSFSDVNALRKHRHAHQRQHICPVCHKSYQRLAQLVFHMRHHDRKRFIQFGSNFHEVRVISSRNVEGQMVQEHYLLLLLSKEEQSKLETEKSSALSERKTDGDSGTAEKMEESTADRTDELPAGRESEQENKYNTTEMIVETRSDGSKTADKETSRLSVQGTNANENSDEGLTAMPVAVTAADPQRKVLYKCGHCKRVFFTRPSLSRHLIKHTNTKPFQCDKCLKSFRDKTDLLHHYKTHTKPVPCPTCHATFSKSLYLRNHLDKGCPSHPADDRIIVLEDMRCLCKVCQKVLKSKANAIRHLRIHDFQERSKSKPKADNVETERPQPLTSDLSQDVEDHFRPLESSVGFQCLLCGEELRFKSFMVTHVRKHLNQRLFKCDQCPKSFFARHVLRKHQQNHTRPYKCPVCDKGFIRRYMMAQHFSKRHNLPEGVEDPMKDITELPDQKLIQCDICGKTMKQSHKSIMLYHIRLHKDVRPFKCEKCSKSFISDNALKKHSLTHSKPYVCQVCGMGFSRRYLLTEHFKKTCIFKVGKTKDGADNPTSVVNMPAQNQSQASVPCEAKFTQSEGLCEETSHLEGSGNEYYCEPCSKRFTVHDTFLRHMKTFSKPTACKYCKQVFEDKHIAMAHQRSCLGLAIPERGNAHFKQDISHSVSGDWQERVKIMAEVNKTIENVSSEGGGADVEANVTQSTTAKHELERRVDENRQARAATLKNTVEALKSKHGKYSCPQCERIFSTPRGLKIHASIHVRLFKCETCDLEFKTIKALRSHSKKHEEDTGTSTSNNSENPMSGDLENPLQVPGSEEYGEEELTDTGILVNNHLTQNQSEASFALLSLAVANEESEHRSMTSTAEGLPPASSVPNSSSSKPSDQEESKDTVLKDSYWQESPGLKLMQLGTRGRPYRCQYCRKRFTQQAALDGHVVLAH